MTLLIFVYSYLYIISLVYGYSLLLSCYQWDKKTPYPNTSFTVFNLLSLSRKLGIFEYPLLPILIFATSIPIINILLILFYIVYFYSEIYSNVGKYDN